MVIGFNYPTDVKWERLCVSPDMMYTNLDLEKFPPKWNSSISLFRYTPAEDYQVYPGRTISYLKAVVSITGYQAKEDEIEGEIEWNKVSLESFEEFSAVDIGEELDYILHTYHPCHGAILQVAVIPQDFEPPENGNLDFTTIHNFPYIMDFQPKKRDLYEMATDTNEQSSGSLDTVSTGKASASTEGWEYFNSFYNDVVKPTTTSGSARSLREENKLIGNLQETNIRTTDKSRDARQTKSHTTHISNLYTLLNTYHLGSNRVVFFIQPRPHVIEQPSFFVDGPRNVEGIQEFFIVVNQPKDTGDYCVLARLDTSHITRGPPPWPILITTRGFRCCPNGVINFPGAKGSGRFNGITNIIPLDKLSNYSRVIPIFQRLIQDSAIDVSQIDFVLKSKGSISRSDIQNTNVQSPNGLMSIREANELAMCTKEAIIRSFVSRNRSIPGTISFLDIELLPDMLMSRLGHSGEGRKILGRPAKMDLIKPYATKLRAYFRKDIRNITLAELLELRTKKLSRILNVDETSTNRLKLALLGIPTKKMGRGAARSNHKSNDSGD